MFAMWHSSWIPSGTLSYHNLLIQRLELYSPEPTDKCPKPLAKVTREAEIESYQFSSMVPMSSLWIPTGDLSGLQFTKSDTKYL